MKTKKILTLSLVLSMFAISSCDDALDINRNPLVASSADPNAVLPYVLVNHSTTRTSELGARMLDVVGYNSRSFASPVFGTVSQFLTGNTWSTLYSQDGSNLVSLERDAKAAGPSNNNIAAISLILQGLHYLEATMIWEEVPFTQAHQPLEFPNPIYDDQETVLRGILTLLDEATTLIAAIPATGVANVSNGDLIYGGNMTRWEMFANSLKLRTLMILRNKDTSVDTQINALMTSPMIEANVDDAFFAFYNTPGNENPFQQLVDDFASGNNEVDAFFNVPPVFLNLLNGNNDPRLDLFLTRIAGAFVATPLGGFGISGVHSAWKNEIVRADYPDVLFGAAETVLYKAELMLLGVIPGGAAGADAEYRRGIDLAFGFYATRPGAISNAVRDTYKAGLPDLSTLAAQDALDAVYTEQWIEGFPRAIEGWTHIRRTDFPAHSAPPGASIATYLKRFVYPQNEINTNANVPINKPADMKHWFEK